MAGCQLQAPGITCQTAIKDSVQKSEVAAKRERLLTSLQISGASDLSLKLAVQTLSQWNSSGNHFQNRVSGEHHLEYIYTWSRKGFTVSLKMISELGYTCFPDSLFYKQKDIQTFRYDVSASVNKNWHLSLSTCTTTPLYRMISYGSMDSLGIISIFTGSFLTPLIMLASAGIKITAEGLGTFHVGLSSLKLVYVNDPEVFHSMQITRYYGVEKGDQWQCEYGLSSSVDLVKKLTPHLSWQCRLDTFIAWNKSLDILLKNLLSVKAGRSMNATIQSSIVYDKDLSSVFLMENLLTIGFAVRFNR